MLYYKFQNYEEFKELSGIQKHGNGVCSRKNKILLAFIKNRELLHKAIATGDTRFLRISSMPELKKLLTQEISRQSQNDERLPYLLNLNGNLYYSSIYSTDDNLGLCEDGDAKAVRYINNEDMKTYKMKAGKLYRSIILETEFGRSLPEQVVTYLCEEFVADWQVYAMMKVPKNKLCIDQNFEKIYSSESCVGDFHSCMVDKEYHYFYQNAVDASAAYLTNEDGKIIARCIIYNKVMDKNDKIWRLAERQYSSDEDDILKRSLIDALIKGGHIDGYKKVGAGCGEARNFVDLDGNSLAGYRFRIECNLDYDDTLSYQDSFKWYDEYKRIADNYGDGDIALDTTEGSIDGEDEDEDRPYDTYHDYYCDNTHLVYLHGIEYYCDTENMDDFIWIEESEEYHHEDDVLICPECNEYYLETRTNYSDITEKDYCCSECREKAEETYKQKNWFYSEYDEEFYEDEYMVVSYQEWNPVRCSYKERTISIQTLEGLVKENRLYEIDEIYYDEVDEETGLPYIYEMEEMTV